MLNCETHSVTQNCYRYQSSIVSRVPFGFYTILIATVDAHDRSAAECTNSLQLTTKHFSFYNNRFMCTRRHLTSAVQ